MPKEYQMRAPKKTRKKIRNRGHVRIAFRKHNGPRSIAVEHPYTGSFESIRRFNQFREQLEALCDLPKGPELRRILEVSSTTEQSSIWRRARLSPLEEKAIQIFSILAFSSKERWCHLLRRFFRFEGWPGDLRGQPRLDFRSKELRPIARGLGIEKLVSRLRPGYEMCALAKKRGGYNSGEEQIAIQLKALHLDEHEREALLRSKSVEDAACRYL